MSILGMFPELKDLMTDAPHYDLLTVALAAFLAGMSVGITIGVVTLWVFLN